MRTLVSLVMLMFLAGSAQAALTCTEAENLFTSAVEPLWTKARDAYAANNEDLGDGLCDQAYDNISELISNTPEQCTTQIGRFLEFQEELDFGDVCGIF